MKNEKARTTKIWKQFKQANNYNNVYNCSVKRKKKTKLNFSFGYLWQNLIQNNNS